MSSDDRTWFEPLVRSFSDGALRFAFMNVGDVETAREIVQEAFLHCWSSRNTPSSEADFHRWLYRLITNLARDYHRKRIRFNRLPVPPIAPFDPIEQVERRSDDEEILAAVRALNLRERQAIYLRYFEDYSFADTARIMGSPEVSIRVVVHRALGKLRRQLEPAMFKEVVL